MVKLMYFLLRYKRHLTMVTLMYHFQIDHEADAAPERQNVTGDDALLHLPPLLRPLPETSEGTDLDQHPGRLMPPPARLPLAKRHRRPHLCPLEEADRKMRASSREVRKAAARLTATVPIRMRTAEYRRQMERVLTVCEGRRPIIVYHPSGFGHLAECRRCLEEVGRAAPGMPVVHDDAADLHRRQRFQQS